MLAVEEYEDSQDEQQEINNNLNPDVEHKYDDEEEKETSEEENQTSEEEEKINQVEPKDKDGDTRMIYDIRRKIRRAVLSESVAEWHPRLGHISREKLIKANQVFRLRLSLDDIEKFYDKVCEVCAKANAKRKAIHHKGHHPLMETIDVGMIFYVDIFGPTSVNGKKINKRTGKEVNGKVPCPSLWGENYGIVGVEGHTRLVKYESIKNKSDANAVIIKWIEEIEATTGRTIKFLHVDNAKDLTNIELEEYMVKKGIQYSHPTPYHPAHNGVVERMIGLLRSVMRTLLLQSGAPTELWSKAVNWAALMHNCLPKKVINYQTPYMMYCNYRFDIPKYAKVWGCDAYVTKTPPVIGKSEPRAWTGIFIGYDTTYQAYQILDQKNKIITTKDVTFNEFKFTAMEALKSKIDRGVIVTIKPKRPLEESSINFDFEEEEEEKKEDETSSEVEQDLEDEEQGIGEIPPDINIADVPIQRKTREELIREKVMEDINKAIEELEAKGPYKTRSGRPVRPRTFGKIMGAVTSVTKTNHLDDMMYNIPTPWFKEPPKSYKESQQYEDKEEWYGAIKDEFKSLIANKTWILVPRTPKMKVLKGKWVLDYKLGEFNELLRRKARYVIKGYEQIYGVNYLF